MPRLTPPSSSPLTSTSTRAHGGPFAPSAALAMATRLCAESLEAVALRCAPRQRPLRPQAQPRTRSVPPRGRLHPLPLPRVRRSVRARATHLVASAVVGGERVGAAPGGKEGASFSREAFEQLVLRLQSEICEQVGAPKGAGSLALTPHAFVSTPPWVDDPGPPSPGHPRSPSNTP